MSNKLRKYSSGYKEAKKKLVERIEKEGGTNITPELMKEFTEVSEGEDPITEEEFYKILDDLQKKGKFKLFKISQICEDKETRGLMICDSSTIVAFAKDPNANKE